jgi:hypothetical protein
MPARSSRKRERQYEHIKESYQDRGVSKGEGEERGSDGEHGAPQGRRDQEEALMLGCL